MSEAVHILLVEEDAAERQRIARVLDRARWQVIEAPTGRACLATLRRTADCVVLLELRLPDVEGVELLGEIVTRFPDTPIVVVTAVDDLGIAVDVVQRGAWDYVVKRPDLAYLEQLPHVVTRALARRQLVRERNRYREEMEALAIALRGTTDGVAILDPVGRISFVNRALAEAWGHAEAAVVGRLLGDFVHLPESEGALGDVLAAVAERGRWNGELHTRGAEASQGVWDVTLTPILGKDTGSVGLSASARVVVAIFRDFSERRQLEQLRADFLSMVTHDIKAPLTVILGYTELLTDTKASYSKALPEILQHIRESGEKIHALVCDFLDLSRIEAGQLTLDRRLVDLRALVAHAVEQHAASARRKGLALNLKTEPLPAVTIDESQIERVVVNLLGNAIKYTPGGGEITVTASRHNGHVVVAVHDTGRGIPRDELPHLFEKYRRVREGLRTEGTGLGLFIAKTIVEAHGGNIRVESEPGAGSTFTMLLPAA